jgi:hypothetical protein
MLCIVDASRCDLRRQTPDKPEIFDQDVAFLRERQGARADAARAVRR